MEPIDERLQSPISRSPPRSPPRAGTAPLPREYIDIPSTKYRELDNAVSHVVLSKALAPMHPTLPRMTTKRIANSTAIKGRDPMKSNLLGPGRAQKYGELISEKGSRYEGEVLAGRPHGIGSYFRLHPAGYRVEYEGEWVGGFRQGRGTRHYPNNEKYEGEFYCNVRHGCGAYSFSNGDVYNGEWVDDHKTGHGTVLYVNGDVFVGSFLKDKKEGRGTLFMLSRQRKMISEYVSNQPKCGSVVDIENDDLEPLYDSVKEMVLTARLDMTSKGLNTPSQLPDLGLKNPSVILAKEVSKVRKERAEKGGIDKAVQEHSGCLSAAQIQNLRHSFVLIAASDTPTSQILVHQLREVIAMAGLDPSHSSTRQLVERLISPPPSETVTKGFFAITSITLERFMQIVVDFQEESCRAPLSLDSNGTGTLGNSLFNPQTNGKQQDEAQATADHYLTDEGMLDGECEEMVEDVEEFDEITEEFGNTKVSFAAPPAPIVETEEAVPASSEPPPPPPEEDWKEVVPLSEEEAPVSTDQAPGEAAGAAGAVLASEEAIEEVAPSAEDAAQADAAQDDPVLYEEPATSVEADADGDNAESEQIFYGGDVSVPISAAEGEGERLGSEIKLEEGEALVKASAVVEASAAAEEEGQLAEVEEPQLLEEVEEGKDAPDVPDSEPVAEAALEEEAKDPEPAEATGESTAEGEGEVTHPDAE